ncbi:hypothetical protein V1512DRAFT_202358 [Lipomyces arxii]|uniref:uncharacterized protein n=1 Tax=Lipomyces arxii TaxID=56418 RepID=UPI0034CDDA0A
MEPRGVSPILHDHAARASRSARRNMRPLDLPPVSDLTEIPPAPIEEDIALSAESEKDESNDKKGGERMMLWRYYLLKVHKYSSYGFTGFLALHLATVSATPAVFGIEAGDRAMMLARVLYQTPGIEETLVYGTLAVHVVSGVMLRVYKIYRDRKWYSHRLKLSRVAFSGYLLLPFVASHFVVTRLIPLVTEGDSSLVSLRYIAHGFARSSAVSWGFYLLFVSGTAYHVGYGWARWLRLHKLGRVRLAQFGAFLIGVLGLRAVNKGQNVSLYVGRKYDVFYDTNKTQVFRWTALASGVVYGGYHSFVLKSEAASRRAAAEWAHKESLISQAKAEYAKLHPSPVVAASTNTLDLSDPNFDFA